MFGFEDALKVSGAILRMAIIELSSQEDEDEDEDIKKSEEVNIVKEIKRLILLLNNAAIAINIQEVTYTDGSRNEITIKFRSTKTSEISII